MMRKTLSLLFVALAAMSAGADGIQVIHLGQGDALSTLLDRTQAADSLVISGPMDADDCDALGAYCREAGPRGINLADAQFEDDELPMTALGWLKGITLLGRVERETRNQIEYVTLPAGLQTVGKRSLYGMFGLKEAVVPQGVTSIKDEAFCASGITRLVLPAGLKEIGREAFFFCQSLQSLDLPDGLERIGGKAFENTDISEVRLPSQLAELNYGTFSYCYKLTKVVFTGPLEEIGMNGFCYSPVKEVVWPAGLKTIGEWAFDNCAFERLDLPYGLEEISDGAFQGNDYLREVTLPSTLVRLSHDAFCYCYALETMVCRASVPPVVVPHPYGADNVEWMFQTVLYVPDASVESYRHAPYWQNFKEIKGLSTSGIAADYAEGGDDSPCYDLQGRRLTAKPRHGLYIQGGRKYVVK